MTLYDTSARITNPNMSQLDEPLLNRQGSRTSNTMPQKREFDAHFRSDRRIFVLLLYNRRSRWVAGSVVNKIGVTLFEIQIKVQEQSKQPRNNKHKFLNSSFRLYSQRNFVWMIRTWNQEGEAESERGTFNADRKFVLIVCIEEALMNRRGCYSLSVIDRISIIARLIWIIIVQRLLSEYTFGAYWTCVFCVHNKM